MNSPPDPPPADNDETTFVPQVPDESPINAGGKTPGDEHPARIGRYRVERLLGQGGFGQVYLAYDEQLKRRVAVKVPHRRRIATPSDAAQYLAEARAVASLDHPRIVPVHDVSSSDEFPCFVVSKYVPGRTLSDRIKQSRPSYTEAAELVVAIAEALHHAHTRGLVHRDVKPGNIQIDEAGQPSLLDFGLALREQEDPEGPGYVGTPAYMSPEQARGEADRVDGRSDIFSLGVVLYEMLAGRRPFRGKTREELRQKVLEHDPSPPRQYDPQIPRELERICLKALAKRPTDRYTTAYDLIDDLQKFLAGDVPPAGPRPAPLDEPAGTSSARRGPGPASATESLRASGESTIANVRSEPVAEPLTKGLPTQNSRRNWLIGAGVALAGVAGMGLWQLLGHGARPKRGPGEDSTGGDSREPVVTDQDVADDRQSDTTDAGDSAQPAGAPLEAPAESVNLLTLIDTKVHAYEGLWIAVDKSLVARPGKNTPFGANVPWSPPTRYRLRMRLARRFTGEGFLALGLASGTGRFTLLVDIMEDNKPVTGLAAPRPRKLEPQRGGRRGPSLPRGESVELVVTVEPNSLVLHSNGRPMFKRFGDVSHLVRPPAVNPAPLFLAGNGSFVFESIVLESMGDGVGEPLTKSD